jgi:hypothetical protein
MYDSPRLHDPSFTLSKSHGLSPANANHKRDTTDSIHKIQSVATECDDIQTTVLMNWVVKPTWKGCRYPAMVEGVAQHCHDHNLYLNNRHHYF